MRWPWSKRKRERRSLAFESPLLSLGPSVADSPEESLRLSTVYACVDRLASTISTLPLHLFEEGPCGKRRVADHPLARLWRVGPNAFQTTSDFSAYIMRCLLLRGNAYSRIYRSSETGEITSILPIDPDRVKPRLAASKTRLEYFIDDSKEPLPEDSIWHVRGLPAANFLLGMSVISAAAAVIDAGLKSQDLQEAVVDNTSNPRDIFETDGTLNDEEAAEFLRDWKEKTSGRQTGGSYILPQGLTHRQLSISLADKEFIEARRLTVDEIAGIFGLPRWMVSGDGQGSADQWDYVKEVTLSPWLKRIEQSCVRDCFLPSEQDRYFLRYSMDGLLRANLVARANAYQAQMKVGLLSVNEARALEDRPPLPRGNIVYAPLDVAHIDSDTGRIIYNGPQNPVPTEGNDAEEP